MTDDKTLQKDYAALCKALKTALAEANALRIHSLQGRVLERDDIDYAHALATEVGAALLSIPPPRVTLAPAIALAPATPAAPPVPQQRSAPAPAPPPAPGEVAELRDQLAARDRQIAILKKEVDRQDVRVYEAGQQSVLDQVGAIVLAPKRLLDDEAPITLAEVEDALHEVTGRDDEDLLVVADDLEHLTTSLCSSAAAETAAADDLGRLTQAAEATASPRRAPGTADPATAAPRASAPLVYEYEAAL